MKESFEIGATVRVTLDSAKLVEGPGGTKHREGYKFTNRFNKIVEVKDGLYTIDTFNQSVFVNLMEKKYAKVEKVSDLPETILKADSKQVVKIKPETNNG